MEQYYWVKFQQQQQNQMQGGGRGGQYPQGSQPPHISQQQQHHHQRSGPRSDPPSDSSSASVSPGMTYGRPNQQYDSTIPPPFELPPGGATAGYRSGRGGHPTHQQGYYGNSSTPPMGPALAPNHQAIQLMQPGPGKGGKRARFTASGPTGHVVGPEDEEGQFQGDETDDRRLSQRTKQINFGKVTEGYRYYRFSVPTFHRQPANAKHPATPRISMKCSKRRWDTLVAAWRRALHAWDEEPDPETMRLPNAETLVELGAAASVPLNLYVAETLKELDAVQQAIKHLTEKPQTTQFPGESPQEPDSSSDLEKDSATVVRASAPPTAGGCKTMSGSSDTTSSQGSTPPPAPVVSLRGQELLDRPGAIPLLHHSSLPPKSPSPTRIVNPELVMDMMGANASGSGGSGSGESPSSTGVAQQRPRGHSGGALSGAGSFGHNGQYTTPQHHPAAQPGQLDPTHLSQPHASPPTVFSSFIMLRLVHRHSDGDESERIITVSAIEGVDGIHSELAKRHDLSKLYIKAPHGMKASGSTNQLAGELSEPSVISPRSTVPKPLATHPGEVKPTTVLDADGAVNPSKVPTTAVGRRQQQLYLDDRENLIFLLRQKFAPTLYYESDEEFAPEEGADYDVQRELDQFTPTRVMFATQAGSEPQLVFSSSAAATAYTPNPMALASRLSPGGFFNENQSPPLTTGSGVGVNFGAMRSREGSVISPTQQLQQRRSPLEGQ